ncbi:MAG: hypothetical protein M3O46_04380 [Myxococcota bacterium]|nr:hypothetical protein [Myxococcota bacterium]
MQRWAMVLLASAWLATAVEAHAEMPSATAAQLESRSIDERRVAAAVLSSPDSHGSKGVDEIGQELDELRRGDDESVIRVMSGVLSSADQGTDLVERLVRRDPGPAVARTLATVCLVRALTRIGTTPAVRRLVVMASFAEGLLRPELFRALRELDDRASAALIEARGDPSPEIRAWAKDVLEALGKRTPGDAVQTTNDRILVDVLHAYAATRDPDALAVVLSFVNSERAQVRNAAREATLAYGQDALEKLRSTYAAMTGERLIDDETSPSRRARHDPDAVDAISVAHRLFDAWDHVRLRDVYARLDEGFAKQHSGDIKGAVADFDNVLARQPLLDRRAEIAPAYVAYAEALEESNPARAADYLRRALRLDETGPERKRIESELRYLDGEDLLSRGIADPEPYEEALKLDVENARARAKLDGMRAKTASRREREGRVAASVSTIGVAFVAVGVAALGRQRRRRQR